jgi:hypothetical protein
LEFQVRRLLLTFVTLTFAQAAKATPLVFDFESGVQGWTLGAVERVSGSPLGEDFAIFGEAQVVGGPPPPHAMWIELDLSPYESLTFARLQADPADPVADFVRVSIRPIPDPGGLFFPDPGVSLVATAEDPFPNPDLRRVDLSNFEGVHTVTFHWVANLVPHSGFVDDITFHPIPEPSSALLLSLGLVLLRTATRSRSAA